MKPFFIPKKFPSLNDVIKEARGNKYGSNKQKQDLTDYVRLYILTHPEIYFVESARFKFTWIEPNKRRDPDNIASSQKFLFDGFVKGGILRNDKHAQVKGIQHEFGFGAEGVWVEIIEQGE